jgi:tRNA dimethylallyltransferase
LRRPSAGDAERVPRPAAGHDDGPVRPVPLTLIAIVGPTGTGKTELAVELAERIGGEIVGCDALQVYRGFDRATAKPSLEQRRRARHHLIDFADPCFDFSLAEYVHLADRAIRDIHSRDRVPLVVGGTGMYLRGLLRGVVDAPERDDALRARLRGMARRFGAPRLHRWLSGLDPGSAGRLPVRDTQRIVRALEIALSGGPTWSERLRSGGTWSSGEERYRALKIVLDMGRERLARRLDDRVGAFFDAGLVEEVRELLSAGVPATANAFKAIGYREVLAALSSGIDPASVVDEVRRSTRRYAKRQRTWFRGEPDTVEMDAARPLPELVDEIVRRWGELAGDRPGSPRDRAAPR